MAEKPTYEQLVRDYMALQAATAGWESRDPRHPAAREELAVMLRAMAVLMDRELRSRISDPPPLSLRKPALRGFH